MTSRYAILNDDDSVRLIVTQDVAPVERHVVVTGGVPTPSGDYLTLVAGADGALSWVDRRTPVQQSVDAIAEVQVQAARLEEGGFTFRGIAFASDLTSQVRVLLAAFLASTAKGPYSRTFLGAGGEELELDAAGCVAMAAALADHLSSVDQWTRDQRRRIPKPPKDRGGAV